jgi:hypothetical protein
MKQIALIAGLIFILAACTVSSPSNEDNQQAVLKTYVVETIEAVHANATASAPAITTAPAQTSGPASLATITLIPLTSATQSIPTMIPLPTSAPVGYPTLPAPVVTAPPPPSNSWQLLTNIPDQADPGETMDVKIKTTVDMECVLSYIGSDWSGEDSFNYHKNADENGICEWSWSISPESIGEVANIIIEVQGNKRQFDLWINGPTPTVWGE